MSRFCITARLILMAVVTMAFVNVAQAQAIRTWVSGVGDDVNPCSRTAPCKTWAGAISKTAINGEIDALDPGSYGTVTITKSITLEGGEGAGFGATTSSGVNGMTINIAVSANDPTRTVRLRNLSITGMGLSGSVGTRTGLNGINLTVNGAANLYLERVVISDFTQNGININATSTTNVMLNEVTVRRCPTGLKTTTTSGQVVVMVNNSNFGNNETIGIDAVANTRMGIKNSVVSHSGTGIRTSGSNSIINIQDAFVTFCSTALTGSAGSTINVSDSIIAQNSTGLNLNGGTINSFQGNSLVNNTTPGAFSNITLKT